MHWRVGGWRRLRRALLSGLLVAGSLVGSASTADAATVVYSEDFDLSEWSLPRLDTTPGTATHDDDGFLGQLGNETASLSLSGLPAHTELVLNLDLFVILTWDGNNSSCGEGPDIFDLDVNGGATLLHTTFNNGVANPCGTQVQAYPDAYPGGANPTRTGADENDTLGYDYSGTPQDSVYNLSFTFAHTSSEVQLDFSAAGLQSVSDESWGLDDIEVKTGSGGVVYSEDFEFQMWDPPRLDNTPGTVAHPADGFLGQFDEETARLSIESLPAHTELTVSFDLYVIGPWSGNDQACGPDIFDLTPIGLSTLLHTTFHNGDPCEDPVEQAYPDSHPDGVNPARTGADENNTLGYDFAGAPLDSVYDLSFTFAHTDPEVRLEFSGITNLSWGIDNVELMADESTSDETDPTVTITTPPDGATYAQGETVLADYACTDEGGGSGLASCMGPVANGEAIDTSTVGAMEFTVDAADGAGNTASLTHDYTVVDETDPTVTITVPSDGATYPRGQTVLADYACSDEIGGSGLASCIGAVADGAPIDTSAVGSHSFAVTATDNAGNTGSFVHAYTVVAGHVVDVLDVQRMEGSGVNIGVGAPRLTPGSDRTLTITATWVLLDGTATSADNDYTGTGGTITWQPGPSGYSVFATGGSSVIGDSKAEPDEAFSIQITSVTNAVLGDGEAVITLLNDDGVGGECPGFGGIPGNHMVGTPGDDLLFGGLSTDIVCGLGGDDRLYGGNGTGSDIVDGGAGNDSLNGGAGNDVLDGGPGDDAIAGSIDDDRLIGGVGNDTLNGDGESDSLIGGDGSDTLFGGRGDNVMDGGTGNDLLGMSGVNCSYIPPQGTQDGTNTMNGGAGNDILRGGESGDILQGEAGDDTVDGCFGSDNVSGGDGNDQVLGSSLPPPEPQFLNPGNLGDHDTLLGGAGADVLKAANRTPDPFYTGSVPGSSMQGGGGDDKLVGDDADDVLSGGFGQDELLGSWRRDSLDGGPGPDLLDPGTGQRDQVAGGPGIDSVTYADRTSGVRLSPGGGNDDGNTGENDNIANDVENFTGGTGNDTLTGNGDVNRLQGGPGNDTLGGNGDDDTLLGGPGIDELEGGTGDDGMNGKEGSDSLVGDGGDDILLGESGGDVLLGKSGSDYLNGGANADFCAGGTGSDTKANCET